jgi:hypothetical protein
VDGVGDPWPLGGRMVEAEERNHWRHRSRPSMRLDPKGLKKDEDWVEAWRLSATEFLSWLVNEEVDLDAERCSEEFPGPLEEDREVAGRVVVG